ncbi:hypothetical protein ACFPH6_12420 [Streptomyces xiangluensis]|uniref:Uncharacterized protein n=1 Tax=Streptomyces xiangluensis TaxID=2665720 RepID=A0ABV8YLU9_9ACTN
MDIQSSQTYRWMLDQGRIVGWDLDETESMQGVGAPRRKILLMWAMIALTAGLTPAQTAQLALGFGVTEEELRAVYEPERREHEMAELLGPPDLQKIDQRLDELD